MTKPTASEVEKARQLVNEYHNVPLANDTIDPKLVGLFEQALSQARQDALHSEAVDELMGAIEYGFHERFDSVSKALLKEALSTFEAERGGREEGK